VKITKKSPDPFFYQSKDKTKSDTAILLIHGFTGSPAEMKLLGEYLHEQKKFTVYAPLLAGHGTTPEDMVTTGKEDWWQSVDDAYAFLQKKGYKKIVAIGLSMGGILALKLAMEQKLVSVISLAAPIIVHDKRIGWSRWLKYVIAYQKKRKKEDHIEEYLASYDRTPIRCVESLHSLMKEVEARLSDVKTPIMIMQGKRDETVDPESANYIYNHVSSKHKKLKWYEKSTHIMTLDREREQIFTDIGLFLEKISDTRKK